MKIAWNRDVKSPGKKFKIALISPPWPIYNRPSMQLGALKAFIHHEKIPADVVSFHPYLSIAEKIGYRTYQALSEKSWLSECLYSWILFPQQRNRIEPFFNRLKKKSPVLHATDICQLADAIQEISARYIEEIPWHEFNIAGVSASLCQLTSTRYFIQKIRTRASGLKVVLGGAIISGMENQDLKILYPEADLFIKGEGEIPFSNLVKEMVQGGYGDGGGHDHLDRIQIKDLRTLPTPDFSDYFKAVGTLKGDKKFFPVLPVEFSRGCWWHAQKKRPPGCAFCNLNSQWEGYRAKTPAQVVSEIDTLIKTHRSLDIAVMDNVLPMKNGASYFSEIQALDKEVRLFCEVRARTPKPMLDQMKKAGVDHVQVGIESLSSRLLKKLNKGTTAIQNIQIMRDLEALDIVSGSNLMVHFPGSDQADVLETLFFLEFVMPYRPLKIVPFQLNQGSAVCLDPSAYGIKRVRNHHHISILFPETIAASVRFPQKSYSGDLIFQKKLWKPVHEKIKVWERAYESGKKHSSLPLLSYRDGIDFILIRQVDINGSIAHHRLEGKSAAIYRFCTQNRSFDRICREFGGGPIPQIKAFLDMMVEKKLMVEEGDRYLSLSISIRKTGS